MSSAFISRLLVLLRERMSRDLIFCLGLLMCGSAHQRVCGCHLRPYFANSLRNALTWSRFVSWQRKVVYVEDYPACSFALGCRHLLHLRVPEVLR